MFLDKFILFIYRNYMHSWKRYCSGFISLVSEFWAFILLVWLSPTVTNPSLLCHFNQIWKEYIRVHTFPRAYVRKSEFELCSLIKYCALMTAMIHVRPLLNNEANYKIHQEKYRLLTKNRLENILKNYF